MKDCICDTRRRWPFYHLIHCPWRRRIELEELELRRNME